ncbi:MAG: serine protease [bacterium]
MLINKEGYILTSKHVVDDTRLHYQVRLVNGNMYKVDKIWLDPLLDLAVIKIAPLHGSLPAPVFFSLKQSARSGERVFIIGNA